MSEEIARVVDENDILHENWKLPESDAARVNKFLIDQGLDHNCETVKAFVRIMKEFNEMKDRLEGMK